MKYIILQNTHFFFLEKHFNFMYYLLPIIFEYGINNILNIAN